MIHILHHRSSCIPLQCWPDTYADIRLIVIYELVEGQPVIQEMRFRTLDLSRGTRPNDTTLLSCDVSGEDSRDSIVLREISAQLERDLELRELMEQHANREART